MNKPIYVVSGEAVDQEKIIELMPQIEDYVREHHGEFSSRTINWNMNKNNHFDYIIKFWA